MVFCVIKKKLLTVKKDKIKTKSSSTLPSKKSVFIRSYKIAKDKKKELLFLVSSKGMDGWLYERNICGI